MSDRRKHNIMKVELAIQRELAYRRKVAMLQPRQDGDPGEHVMPLPVKAQAPDSSSTLSQSLDTSRKSDLCQSLAGTMPAKASSLGSPPPQPPMHERQMVRNREDNLFCNICQVPCSGSYNYREHIGGHKHKARVKELELGQEAANKRFWCTLCNIWCINQDAYGQHLAGQKHQKAEFAKKNGEQIARTPKYCGLCQIWCTDDTTFKMHLKGKNHVFKLHSTQGKKRGREDDCVAEHGP